MCLRMVISQKNQAVVQSLQQKGFYTVAVKNPQGQQVPKVVSNKGEILVGMKDGVEYVLRFGDTYRGLEDDENSTGNSRYIYAFARVNTNLLDAPQLEPVPAPLVEPSTQAPVKNKEETPDKGAKGDTGEKGKEGESPKITPPGPPPNFVPGSPPPTTIPPAPPVAIKDSPSNVLTDGNQSKESGSGSVSSAKRILYRCS